MRPAPDRSVTFQGTYREQAWRRCGSMAAADGIRFTPWPHDEFAGWSLPALEAAKCVRKQSDELFRRVDLRLFEAFFTDSRNIADPVEVIRIVSECGVDVERFVADYRAGLGREAVVHDYEAAVTEHGVRSIPTLIVPETGQALVGLADLAGYRALVEEAAALA